MQTKLFLKILLLCFNLEKFTCINVASYQSQPGKTPAVIRRSRRLSCMIWLIIIGAGINKLFGDLLS